LQLRFALWCAMEWIPGNKALRVMLPNQRGGKTGRVA
jgi:hypothetical protein